MQRSTKAEMIGGFRWRKRSYHGMNFSLNKDVNNTFFTPGRFSGDEDLIAKTTEQFVKQEIVPQIENIEQHNYKVSRQLFEKAGELGLLGIEVP